MRLAFSLALCVAVLGCSQAPVEKVPQTPIGAKAVVFPASDGQMAYGFLYRGPSEHPKGVILMFHQADSSAGEYADIAPRIVNTGFDCLAVDQRSGGEMFGRKNETATRDTGPKDYAHAYNDMLGALAWARKMQYKLALAWGSSYSASLSLRLAAENPDLKGLILFSPGEYFDDKSQAANWARRVTVPVFFACTPDELKEGRQALFNAIPGHRSDVLLALPGSVHGSSSAIQSRAPTVAQSYIQAVQKFIEKHWP